MEKFSRYLEYNYSKTIDGPPLRPHTIAGAEVQIQELASQIRTTFNLDPRFAEFKQQIFNACQLLEKAAMLLGKDMDGEIRNSPHKFHPK